MEVRTKIGWKAGQIQDVSPEAARAMLADGRATDPRDESDNPRDDQAPAAAAAPATTEKARKGRKGK